MQKSVCIIDLSAPEIRARILTGDQFEIVDFQLPWAVGFRQEIDGTLIACFDDVLDQLDSNRPEEVLFTELDVYLKEIEDPETLEYLFHTFFEEIFRRCLTDSEHPIETVYVITPYQWKFVHRQQLRSVFKEIKSNSPVLEPHALNVTLRGILNQILCLVVYYQEAWENLLTDTSGLHLFLVDFQRHDLILYQLNCEQSADSLKVELCDILRYPDFFMDVEDQVANVHRVLKTTGGNLPVAVGFSGAINNAARAVIELLHTRCSVECFEPQETAALLGGAALVQQFETKSLIKPIYFSYQFCFGVLLPGDQWVELIPKAYPPPCHRKKAFRISGILKSFDIHLFCGLSLTDNSDIHYLSTLEIHPPEGSRTLDFILSVDLPDPTHGTFTLNLPDQHVPESVEFNVPVLMD